MFVSKRRYLREREEYRAAAMRQYNSLVGLLDNTQGVVRALQEQLVEQEKIVLEEIRSAQKRYDLLVQQVIAMKRDKGFGPPPFVALAADDDEALPQEVMDAIDSYAPKGSPHHQQQINEAWKLVRQGHETKDVIGLLMAGENVEELL